MTLAKKLFFVLLYISIQASAAPKNIRDYTITHGGLANIQNGAYVEGSVKKGGIQPDYYIDLQQEPLKSIMNKSNSIKNLDIDYWDKIGMVIEIIKTDFFKYSDYHNPYYRRLLKKYRLMNEDIPLSEYGQCQAGVCREYALVLHFALKAAGIENKHAYADIYRASRYDNFEVNEDHAFVVVNKDKVLWVVDAYYWGFNGFKLQDLLSPEGITEHSQYSPIATPGPGTRKIKKINTFPIIYNPKKISCNKLFN